MSDPSEDDDLIPLADDDEDELRPPPLPAPPGPPLPRIHRTAPLTAAEAEEEDGGPSRARRAKPREEKAKAGKADRDRADDSEPPNTNKAGSGPGSSAKADKPRAKIKAKDRDRERAGAQAKKAGVLVEETPELDTYESRQRIRIVVGLACLAFLALGILFIVRAVGTGTPPPEPPPGPAAMPPAPPPRPAEDQSEALAGQLLASAEAAAKGGNDAVVEDRLRRILANYPKTAAAAKASAALEQHGKGLPFFGPGLVAEKVEPPPVEPPKRVDVEVVRPPAPAASEVNIRPPDHPPEPRRAHGLPLEVADVEPRPLPPGFRMRIEAGVNGSGWPNEITCDRDGGSLVLIPGGTFLMGRAAGSAADSPAHRVRLPAYYIDQHEVTSRQFRLFLERTGYKAEKYEGPDDDRPAVNVSHRDAAEYAAWAGKVLPTEAQWEMAARTIDGRIHPWGPDSPHWEKPREPRQIDLVMSYPTDLSPYGVFDLAGNAWEWTADVFDGKYYRHFKDVEAVNPAGPPAHGRDVQYAVRGISKTWQASERIGMPAGTRLPYLGFRCALNIEGGGPPSPGGAVAAPNQGPAPPPGGVGGGGAVRPF